MNSKIKVEGMTCKHCKANVENGILNLEGVTSVNANINSGEVIIEGKGINLEEVKEAVNDRGYKFVE